MLAARHEGSVTMEVTAGQDVVLEKRVIALGVKLHFRCQKAETFPKASLESPK